MAQKLKFTEDQKKEMLQHHQEGKSCRDIGLLFNASQNTIIRILKKEFNCKMYKEPPKIGDVVKGWKILDIYTKRHANQNMTMARVITTLEGDTSEREVRLTQLTNEQIGRSDNYRNDNILRNTTHGKSKTRIYRIWASMKERCLNEKTAIKTGYQKLGIKIYEDWKQFENFEKWAMANGYDDDLTIDRIDSKGHYFPDNCRWATWAEQCRNKINSTKIDLTAFNETKTIHEWLSDSRCVVSYQCLKNRILSGWDHERAVTQHPERPRKMGIKNWLKLKHKDIYNEYLNNYNLTEDGI